MHFSITSEYPEVHLEQSSSRNLAISDHVFGLVLQKYISALSERGLMIMEFNGELLHACPDVGMLAL